MKKLMYFIFCIFVTSCSEETKNVDFTFFDSENISYSRSTLEKDFTKEYSFKFKPNIILVIADSFDNINFTKQLEVIYQLSEPDLLNFIIVTGSYSAEDKSGYFITPETAKKLTVNFNQKFNIFIFPYDNNKFIHSDSTLDSKSMSEILKNYNKHIEK